MITLISVSPPPVLKVIKPSLKTLIMVAVGPPGPLGPVGPAGPTGNTDSTHNNIAQTAHGFVVGNVLRIQNSATTYLKAQANTAANAEVVGIVSTVIDANNFTLITFGLITGLSGLTKGTVYFLSDTTAGLLTATEPTPDGTKVSKPLLIANGTTSGYFVNHRGVVKSG